MAKLTLVYGPMFAGKSSYLVEQFCEAPKTYQGCHGDPVVAFKPARDTRYGSNDYIRTHDGRTVPCKPVEQPRDMIGKIGVKALVLIDEVHFWQPEPLMDTVREIMYHPYQEQDVICAGVFYDHKGLPFPTMERLSRFADNVVELTGVCEGCEKPSVHTGRRLGFDQEASIVVGGIETYKPLCDCCFKEHLTVVGLTKNGHKPKT